MSASSDSDHRRPPTIAFLTAGAGGMYCGSCMHDNFLVTRLRQQGVDAVLIPAYTPLRTDAPDVSIDRVFFGGITVYLQQKFRLFRSIPKGLVRWLDHPALIRWIAQRHMDTNPAGLGQMTLSMLQGSQGNQRKEVQELVDWLAEELRPDLVVFSNFLIAGAAPDIKARIGCPLLVTLQGDDVFLDGLPRADRRAVIQQMQAIAPSIDGFLTHTRFYAAYMSEYLGISHKAFRQIPLGIAHQSVPVPAGGGAADGAADGAASGGQSQWQANQTGCTDRPETATDAGASLRQPVKNGRENQNQRVVGYLARLAPEKGLDLLCEAVARIAAACDDGDSASGHADDGPSIVLRIAGWQDERHRDYARRAIQRVRQAAGPVTVDWVGEVTHDEKIRFLKSLDVFCVPARFQEPKGLYALEAMACGVPVLLPDHGAFPELIQPVGGTLFAANNVNALAAELCGLFADTDRRRQLADAGCNAFREFHHPGLVAEQTMEVYRSYLG